MKNICYALLMVFTSTSYGASTSHGASLETMQSEVIAHYDEGPRRINVMVCKSGRYAVSQRERTKDVYVFAIARSFHKKVTQEQLKALADLACDKIGKDSSVNIGDEVRSSGLDAVFAGVKDAEFTLAALLKQKQLLIFKTQNMMQVCNGDGTSMVGGTGATSTATLSGDNIYSLMTHAPHTYSDILSLNARTDQESNREILVVVAGTQKRKKCVLQ